MAYILFPVLSKHFLKPGCAGKHWLAGNKDKNNIYGRINKIQLPVRIARMSRFSPSGRGEGHVKMANRPSRLGKGKGR
jgi:hypothetical protein